MKRILLLIGVISLLATAGCILVPEGGRHGRARGHAEYEGRSEVVVGPPVVVMHPPEIIVR